MTLLSLGILLFFFPHLWRELGLREKLQARLPSENAYKLLFSVLSLLGLVLIVIGKTRAPFEMLYEPVFGLRWISSLLMLPASILVVLGNLPTSHLKHGLRHPMLLAVALWGVAHLWANGDLASTLLFGVFTAWSLLKLFTLRHQPRPAKRPRWIWDLIGLVIGLVLYVLIFNYHGHLFGVGLTIG